MRRHAFFLLTLATLISFAIVIDSQAQSVTLKTFNGMNTILVWKDKDSHTEALSLIEAGVQRTNPILIMRLLSCVVDPGTKAIITSMGFATHDIMVVEGEHAGCRGNVAMENVN